MRLNNNMSKFKTKDSATEPQKSDNALKCAAIFTGHKSYYSWRQMRPGRAYFRHVDQEKFIL